MIRILTNPKKLIVTFCALSLLLSICHGVDLTRFEEDDDYSLVDRLRAERLKDMLDYLEKSHNLRAFSRPTRNLAIGRGDGFRPGR
uniref:Neuropeptide F n=1 Tax=Parastrongyloides trichosuri TaxID=131310 RepID=A0A0N4ZQ41_PARTI